ncbi:hypothetical protein ADUPG1_002045, partial [Aduncisulcus paluster]
QGSENTLLAGLSVQALRPIRNIANADSLPTRVALMSLIKPYIGSWLTLYSDSKHIGQMIIILSKLTTLPTTGYPNPPLCEEAWCFFHPVLDLVRNECKGQQLAVDDHSHALKFFSNLCCDAEHGV